MKSAEQFLVAISDSGTVQVTSRGRYDSLVFLGTSGVASVQPGDYITSFFLSGKEEGGHIVALRVTVMNDKGNYVTTHTFFLKYDNSSGKTIIDLETPWIPKPERLGQLFDTGIEVQIKGKRFTSCESRLEKHFNTLFVPDGNLLCRYLHGTAKASEVLKAAREVIQEKSALEKLAELEKKYKELMKENSRIDKEADFLAVHAIRWHGLSLDLKESVEEQLIKRRVVKVALKAIKEEQGEDRYDYFCEKTNVDPRIYT